MKRVPSPVSPENSTATVPSRRAALGIPSDYLLVELVFDGWSLAAADARLPGDPERSELDLGSHLTRPARLLGVGGGPDGCGAGLVARLRESLSQPSVAPTRAMSLTRPDQEIASGE